LVVTLARGESWDPDKNYDNKFNAELKDVDPKFLPDLILYLSVDKYK